MKRLTIYAFYDPDGQVDDYVVDCVAAMSEHSERVLIVSNGKLEAASLRRLADIRAVAVVERANEGFDIWGYKHGLDLVGWSEVAKYDEVVLMNSTIAGPLYPLSEMFDVMDAQDVDFWGVTAHAGEDYDPWDLLPSGALERHIQSYFTGIRSQMLQSGAFREYWDSLAPIRSYAEAVALHEAIFTHKFAELGFSWTSYVDGTDLEYLSPYPLMFLPREVLIEKRCPFFKRKALFLSAPDLVATLATSTTTMVKALSDLGYDLRRVLPSVIRTSHQSDIRLSLNAFETLTSRSGGGADPHDVRVVAWVKDMVTCSALERYRPVLERCKDVVIVTNGELDEGVLNRLSNFEARIVTGKTFADFVREVGRGAQSQDHLLVLGSTSSAGGLSGIAAYVQYETGLRAVAGSDAILASAIAHLETCHVAGALTSPLATLGLDRQQDAWWGLAARTEALLAALGIRLPVSSEKPAWGPPSGIVLAAPGMLATDWELIADAMSDLSEAKAEELLTSLIPFILQSHARLLVFALPEEMTASGIFASQPHALREAGDKAHKDRLRPARVYHNLGTGYYEDESTRINPRRGPRGHVAYTWRAPLMVESQRFDPVEGAGAICSGVTATVNGIPSEVVPVNGLRFGGDLDVFMTTDPMYELSGVTPGADVVVTMTDVSYIDESDFRQHAVDGLLGYGGPLASALTAIHAELTAMQTWAGLRRGVRNRLAKARGANFAETRDGRR